MNALRTYQGAVLVLLLGACAAPERAPVASLGPPVDSSWDGEGHRLRDPDGAVELWGAWIEELATDGFRPRLAQARGLAAAGEFEAVLELLDDARAELPPEPAIQATRAGVLAEMGFPRAAELELERALAQAPDDGHLWWALAVVRNRLGLITKADEALQQARALAKR
jgi:tetratricopeptide (TPR) repeat protein